MTISSVALVVLTSIHHGYGAITYGTPWRWNLLKESIPVICFLLVSAYFIKRKYHFSFKSFWNWLFLLTLIFPVIFQIGAFEVVYCQGFKNALPYLEVSSSRLLEMFPPPMFSQKNDLVFEIIGLQQIIVLFFILKFFLQYLKLLWSLRKEEALAGFSV